MVDIKDRSSLFIKLIKCHKTHNQMVQTKGGGGGVPILCQSSFNIFFSIQRKLQNEVKPEFSINYIAGNPSCCNEFFRGFFKLKAWESEPGILHDGGMGVDKLWGIPRSGNVRLANAT